MDQFPSNSREPRVDKPKPEPVENEKKVQKVVTGEVITRKQGLGKRIKASFMDDSVNMKDYVIFDLLIPSVKDLIIEAVTGGVERAFGGEGRSTSRRVARGISGLGHVNYAGMHRGSGRGSVHREDPRVARGPGARRPPAINEIILATKVEADEVLTQMFDILERYEQVTVGDLYDLIGESTGAHTDEKYGWVDLRGSRTVRVRGGGYMLDLPSIEPLD